ncbi:hypothetical protein GQX74_013130 [Glossina fuscipes]|nr:hypothetical protein GQX74_013130 [Glossina fuscipes]
MRVLLDSSVFMSATTAYNNKNYAVSDQNFSNLRSKYDFSDPNESSQNKIGAESLHDGHYGEESDRSLTVMIPRAKYYPSAMQQILLQHQLAMERNNNLQCERGTQNEEDILFEINKCTNIANSSGNIGLEVQIMPGALVSAGYEVSAIVKESNSAFASNYPEQSPNLTASEDLRQELARSIRCDRVKFHCATNISDYDNYDILYSLWSSQVPIYVATKGGRKTCASRQLQQLTIGARNVTSV